jgi:hypothetical protein
MCAIGNASGGAARRRDVAERDPEFEERIDILAKNMKNEGPARVWRRCNRALAAQSILLALMAAQPALALTALDLEVVRRTPITATTPLSGADIAYEVRLQCAAVDESFCRDTVVELSELPFEVAEIDAGPYPLLDGATFVRGTAGASPPDGTLTLDFADSIPAGTSIALPLVVRTNEGARVRRGATPHPTPRLARRVEARTQR